MKYRQYYHNSYDRLPPQVQEGLKAQYGTNDWPTALRMWDQERGVQYAPRPIQMPPNNPSFNRSTYEKGTYTLPSPATRAFTRLGQGISNFAGDVGQGISNFAGNIGQGVSNAYSNFSEGLEAWEKRNPNWKDAVANFANASLDAKYEGRDGWVAGTRAFADTLDPTSQYNLERQRRIDEMDPAGAAHRELVRKTASDLGVTPEEAERIIQEGNNKAREEKRLQLEKTIRELKQTPQEKLAQKIDMEIREYALRNDKTYDEAKKEMADYAAEMREAKLQYEIAKADKEQALAGKYESQTALNGIKLLEAKAAYDNRDVESLKTTSPDLYEKYLNAYQKQMRINPGNEDAAKEAGWNEVDAEIKKQDYINNLEIAKQQIAVDSAITNLKLDKVKLNEAIATFRERDLSKLTDQYKNIFIIQKNIGERKGVADPEGYAWEQTLIQLERDARDQEAGIGLKLENTNLVRANIKLTNQETEKLRAAQDINNPMNLPPELRARFISGYQNYKGDPEKKAEAGWAAAAGKIKLDDDKAKAETALTQGKSAEILKRLESGLIGETTADHRTYLAEKNAKRFDGTYVDWVAKNAGVKDTKRFSRLVNAHKNKIREEMAAGRVELSDGTVRTGDAAKNLSDSQIETEAIFRAAQQEVDDKGQVISHKTEEKIKTDQYNNAEEERDAAVKMIRAANTALALLPQLENTQFGPLQVVYNTFTKALKQMGWSGPDLDAEVRGINMINQLSTEFALTAVQLTKGAISNYEMELFQQMYISPYNSKEANELRMKMVRYVNLVAAEVNNNILTEIGETGRYVKNKRVLEIGEKAKEKYANMKAKIDAELKGYNLGEGKGPNREAAIKAFPKAARNLIERPNTTQAQVDALIDDFYKNGGKPDDLVAILNDPNNKDIDEAFKRIDEASKQANSGGTSNE